MPSRYQWMRYVVSYPRLSRITRRNGTPYLRFFGLDDLEAFFVTLAALGDLATLAFLVAFATLAALAPLLARATGFFPTALRLFPAAFRPARSRLEEARRFVCVAVPDSAGARPLPTPDRWTSVNNIWSPSELYAQISATEIRRAAHRRFAVSTLETGT